MQIIDNFLTPFSHKLIHEEILSPETQWTFNKNVVKKGGSDNQNGFSTVVYRNGNINDKRLFGLLSPLINLDFGRLIRIRIGYIFNSNEGGMVHDPHVDYMQPHTTQLYYVTDSTAPTYIYKENGPEQHKEYTIESVCDSVANRTMWFNGLKFHRSSQPKSPEARIVVTFNYDTRDT